MNVNHDNINLTPFQKAFGETILLIILGVFLGGIGWGAYAGFNWIVERDRLQELAQKENCVARGGSVTEHIGGMTRFDCVAPITFWKP